jgi:hypothetical protein
LDAGWQEEHGRFVPRLAKFLRTRQFDERPRFDDGVPSVEATDRLLRTGRSK